MGSWLPAPLALVLTLVGCGNEWTPVDQDGDGFTPADGDCWDLLEGPSGTGLSGDEIHPDAAETWYDGVDQDCDGWSDYDQDLDGHDADTFNGTDCDDLSSAAAPGLTETWYDGVDQDCDGWSDYDQDLDGHDSDAYGGEDCDDEDAAIFPGTEETWYDGVDQDCDGWSDYDQDQDGYDSEEYAIGPEADCDDEDAAVFPGTEETWYDGVDQDCDGWSDYDQDQDGQDSQDYDGADCDDEDADIGPEIDETWYDGVDQDCDGESDYDQDQDGYDSDAYDGADCDDERFDVAPDKSEVCNLLDDNCDGTVDEGYEAVDAVTYYRDADEDGYGDASDPEPACEGFPPDGYVLNADDCDDADPAAWPDAPETVGDEVDQDCDETEICYQDLDGDGYRTDEVVASADLDCEDEDEAALATDDGDCDDEDAAISPGDAEIAGDEIDQDCDDAEICYADGDDDGYRTDETLASSDDDCDDPGEALAAEDDGDCDDEDAAISPGDAEITGDEVDQDCDDLEVCYLDADNDGYRLTTTVDSLDVDCADSREALASEPTGDCDDSDEDINPDATEIAGDEVDQDCDDQELCYEDGDEDGYRTDEILVSFDDDCDDPGEALAAEEDGDCDDDNSAISPGDAEVTGDEVDSDCDGEETCYADADGDAWRTGSTVPSADDDCDDAGEAASSVSSGDCDDSDEDIHPGATEVAGDEVDQDCDTDELCYTDDDDDGYRLATTVPSSDATCDGAREGLATDEIDCDDSNGAINAGATEVAGDEIDSNCDGTELCYTDDDDDGYRLATTVPSSDATCDGAGESLATDEIDCDDSNGAINAGATEVAGDEIDSNCDGTELCYTDDDDDGYRLATTVPSSDATCDGAGEGLATDEIDCDDTDAETWPGAPELCDTIDQDCDGEVIDVDEGGDGALDFTTAGMSFAGLSSEDYLEVADAPGLDFGTGSFTIELWVKATTLTGADGAVSDPTDLSVRLLDKTFDSWPSLPHWALDLVDTDGDGLPQLELAGQGAESLLTSTSVADEGLASGAWAHLAVVVDRDAAHTVSYYLNGLLVHSEALDDDFVAELADVSNDSALYVSSPYNSFDGLLDELRVWTTARDGDEILDTLCAPITALDEDYDALLLYLPFEEDYVDAGPNAFEVTASGGPTLTAYTD